MNLVCTYDLQNNYLDEDNPWSEILAATDFAVQITYHTTLQAAPGHLSFVRYMILNTPFIAEWEAIKTSKQKIIDKNNQLENKKRKPHIYRIQDKLLVRNKKTNKYKETYIGPYTITQVWTNVNVTIRR